MHGSKTWNLTKTALARLEGFHVRAAYKMARKYRPKRGANGVWVYPKTADVLGERGMDSIAKYIQACHQTITTYMATRPILVACVGDGQQRRVDTASVVVGATDVLGRNRGCNWI